MIDEDEDIAVGTLLGKYRIVRRIGSGGINWQHVQSWTLVEQQKETTT